MIDLLVCNFNTKEKLERLVRTLWDTTTLSVKDPSERLWRLHIADNGSEDGSREWIEKSASWLCNSIYLNDNIGYAKAINQMAARSNGDILAALNADVWFTNDDVLAIQKRYDEDPTLAILGPKQRNEAGRITHGGILDIFTKPKHRGWSQFDITDQLYRDVIDVGSVSGSAYFVRRSVWNDLAYCPIYKEIDPDSEGAFLQTPHFYEETWLSVHAHAHNYRVTYDGSVSIGHSWHASSAIGSQDYNFAISQTIFRKACAAHGIPTEWD